MVKMLAMTLDQIVSSIDAEIERLRRARALLAEIAPTSAQTASKAKRRVSAAARKRMAEAQRKRWAAMRRAGK
jgi:hypothetical protein